MKNKKVTFFPFVQDEALNMRGKYFEDWLYDNLQERVIGKYLNSDERSRAIALKNSLENQEDNMSLHDRLFNFFLAELSLDYDLITQANRLDVINADLFTYKDELSLAMYELISGDQELMFIVSHKEWNKNGIYLQLEVTHQDFVERVIKKYNSGEYYYK